MRGGACAGCALCVKGLGRACTVRTQDGQHVGPLRGSRAICRGAAERAAKWAAERAAEQRAHALPRPSCSSKRCARRLCQKMVRTPKKRIEPISSHTRRRRWFFAPTTWLERVVTTHSDGRHTPHNRNSRLPFWHAGGRQRRQAGSQNT